MADIKIVITGPFNSGKTEFIRTISEIGVVNTDQPITNPDEQVKETTTVAIDYGKLTLDEDFVLYLFGTPGQARFRHMWEILSRDMLGYIVMVDSTDPKSVEKAKEIIRIFSAYAPVPFIVAANKQDLEDAMPLEEIKEKLGLPPNIKVVPCKAIDKESVREVIIALAQTVLEWFEEMERYEEGEEEE